MARIGIVIYSLAGAGAERVSINLAHEFAAAGHQVDFILGQAGGELFDEVPVGASCIVASQPRAGGWRSAIRGYIDQQSPDVLLAMMEGAGVLAIQAAKGRSVPVYVVSHVHFSRHCRQSPRIKERWLMPMAARWYLPRAAGVIGVSRGVASDIQHSAKLDPGRVHSVYNPILSNDFFLKASEPVEHPWFAPDRNWLNVITVGRLAAQKDHDTLLAAIAMVNQKQPVRLMVFGQGERRDELHALCASLDIQAIVEFSGYDPNPYKFIAGADVFVLSSRWEGFGNVLVEALACGTHVISTDCPSGPSEVLDYGVYGVLVPVNDPVRLSNAIIESDRNLIRHANLDAHLEKFMTSSVARQYLEVMGLDGGGDYARD
ncbi:glycosyltransferase [Alcanivorax sp. DP30]|uniref:glycosyltransferase n=1 Tax=Alcanivorax sp. DP30 TaxID=2606217 RepID=UPI00136D7ADB